MDPGCGLMTSLAFGLAEACSLLSECIPEISLDGQEDVNQVQTWVVNNYAGKKGKTKDISR